MPLAPLLEDREGIIPPCWKRLVSARSGLSEIYQEIEKLPKVSGAAAQPHDVAQLNQLLDQAFKEADNFKDEYVSTEHLLLACQRSKRRCRTAIAGRHGATHDAILKALTAVRGIAAGHRPESGRKISGA